MSHAVALGPCALLGPLYPLLIRAPLKAPPSEPLACAYLARASPARLSLDRLTPDLAAIAEWAVLSLSRSGDEAVDLAEYSCRAVGAADKAFALSADAGGPFVVRAHSTLRVLFSAGLASEKEQAAWLAQEAKPKVALPPLRQRRLTPSL